MIDPALAAHLQQLASLARRTRKADGGPSPSRRRFAVLAAAALVAAVSAIWVSRTTVKKPEALALHEPSH